MPRNFEKLIGTLATHFINLPLDQLDSALNSSLEKIAQVADLDICSIFLFSKDHLTIFYTHEWCAPGIESRKARWSSFPASTYPWMLQRLKNGDLVFAPTLDALPPEASVEKLAFQSENVRTFVLVPLACSGEVLGYVSFCCYRDKGWAEEAPFFLRIAGEMLASVFKRKTAEQSLQDHQERLETVLTHLPVILFAVDKKGIFTLSEGKGLEGLGLKPGQVVGQSAFTLYRDVPLILENIGRALRGESFKSTVVVGHLVFETWHNPMHSPQGDTIGMIGVATDVTDRIRMEEQLVHDAFHDHLTTLPNWTHFVNELETAIAKSKRDPEFHYAVFLLDLDRFKVVNDSLGHRTGDQLLKTVSQKLTDCLPRDVLIARLGGDEFAILFSPIKSELEAKTLADCIQNALTAPFLLDHREIFISTSIGVALSKTGYQHPEDILRDADTAMCRAKTLGKSRYEFFQKSMHENAMALFHLETDLRHAVERQEFLLHYQPILSLKTGLIVGFEALIRWMHPSRGVIPALHFIPLAEEMGLIVPIGRWVLREAWKQLCSWQARFPMNPKLFMTVNFSGVQFKQPGLIQDFKNILLNTDHNPLFLKIEITESTLMENAESAATLLRQLKELPVQICIDDFGTGYSSLSSLARFPVDTLKIDRSFIAQMTTEEESAEIVRTILALAENLAMTVVAEGVETREQYEQLKKLGCDMAQGFYFAKPETPETIEALLESKPRW